MRRGGACRSRKRRSFTTPSSESEERFRIVQELSPSGFAIMRAVRSTLDRAIVDFLVEYINPAGVRMGKYGLQNNVVGKALSEVSPGSMKEPRLFPMYCRAVETGRPEQIELRFESERAVGWFHVQSVPMGGERLAVSYSDVHFAALRPPDAVERTARSEAERASRLKDEFLATLSQRGFGTPPHSRSWARLSCCTGELRPRGLPDRHRRRSSATCGCRSRSSKTCWT